MQILSCYFFLMRDNIYQYLKIKKKLPESKPREALGGGRADSKEVSRNNIGKQF